MTFVPSVIPGCAAAHTEQPPGRDRIKRVRGAGCAVRLGERSARDGGDGRRDGLKERYRLRLVAAMIGHEHGIASAEATVENRQRYPSLTGRCDFVIATGTVLPLNEPSGPYRFPTSSSAKRS
jgi:hypothetical protein